MGGQRIAARLTPEQIATIRARRAAKDTLRDIAWDFKISPSAVYRLTLDIRPEFRGRIRFEDLKREIDAQGIYINWAEIGRKLGVTGMACHAAAGRWGIRPAKPYMPGLNPYRTYADRQKRSEAA